MAPGWFQDGLLALDTRNGWGEGIGEGIGEDGWGEGIGEDSTV